MNRRLARMITLVTLATLVGCGGSGSRAILAESLLTVEDLDGPWSVNQGPADVRLPESGVITDAEREFLPRMDLCDAASDASKDTIDSLAWEAFRQFDLAVDDPVDVPRDREGHIVFAQEFLMSGSSSDLSDALVRLSDGLDACVGDIPAGEEGPGTLTRFDPAPVGDQRIGALYTIGEAGGAGTWYVYVVFVRSGSVLVSLSVADVVLGDLDPLIDRSAVDAITATAVDKID